MTKSSATATHAEIQQWTRISADLAASFGAITRWLSSQGLRITKDYIYEPSSDLVQNRPDIFIFKDANKAMLFKLTFGGS